MEKTNSRTIISNYQDPLEFIRNMLVYRRKSEPQFSVSAEAKALRRVSPSLISLILNGQRRINPDRTDELAKVLNLSTSEKFYFKTGYKAWTQIF